MTEIHSVRPLAAILLAFGTIVLVVLLRRRKQIRHAVTVGSAVLTFGIVASLIQPVQQGQTPTTNLGTLVGTVDLSFQADPLGLIFALTVSGLWVVTAIYNIGFVDRDGLTDRTRYLAALWLSIGSGLGVAFASNLLVLVLFYELTTIGTYPLVAHYGTKRARQVGIEYVWYVIGGGTLVVGGTVIIYSLAGTVTFVPGGIPELAWVGTDMSLAAYAAILSLLAGFAVKGAVMPFHGWLPKAMVAPTTVSGVLHAVVVVKSGVFGIARTVLEIFGPEATAAMGVAIPLAAVAGVTIIVGSLLALKQDDLKRRLAYSTISHLSYVVFGVALLTPAAVVGGLVHIGAHGITKLALFFCVGVLTIETGKKKVSEIAGVGREYPVTMGVFALGACSLAGLPLFAGFVGKWYLLVGSAESHWAVPFVFVLSGALNVAYFWPIVYAAFFETAETADPKPIIDGPLGGRAGTAAKGRDSAADEDPTATTDGGPTDKQPDEPGQHKSANEKAKAGQAHPANTLYKGSPTLLGALALLGVLIITFGILPGEFALFDLAKQAAEASVGEVFG